MRASSKDAGAESEIECSNRVDVGVDNSRAEHEGRPTPCTATPASSNLAGGLGWL